MELHYTVENKIKPVSFEAFWLLQIISAAENQFSYFSG